MTLRCRPWWLAIALLVCGCGESAAHGRPTRVFAAASLSTCFAAMAQRFEAHRPGAKIELHVAGTPQLVAQVREGAPVDVFAAADEVSMQRIVATGRTVGAPRVFAHNRLVIVTAKGNPRGIRGLADLLRGDLRVVLCGPEVPAGRYARQALARAGLAVASLSDEPSVAAVVGKVRLGEVDAGIVYVTDATAAHDVDAVPIPAEHNVVASYPIAVLGAHDDANGAASAAADAFVAFVVSPEGQAILARCGFDGP